MRVAVPAETVPGERRVAVTPETVGQLVGAGLEVLVQSGAGRHSFISDDDYAVAGAKVAARVDADAVDVLLHVRPLHRRLPERLHPGAVTVGFCSPSTELPTVAALRDAKVTSFAMELVPRISRAQSMDALTSQALVGGYRSALEAATRLPRFYPLFMTAAGTVPPARVLVLGAGVAGLQAIATAKRLGAKVFGYDVRPASADEVRSMGATFVELELESLEGAGGYAREMTQDRAARQRELLAPHVAEADVLITTAAVPGRAAPLLVTRDMVAAMRPGSVVVDLAAESGGNVEGSVAGEQVEVPAGDDHGVVTVVGMQDAASTLPVDASRLYAKNVANLLLLMTRDGRVSPDFGDEVVAGTCLTHDGVVLHEPTAQLLASRKPETGAPAPSAEKEA
ncbi:MAG: Re/Si-specific NAD(P)(+) transhydrogenase subunit alpha [Actinomycetes bacterium]